MTEMHVVAHKAQRTLRWPLVFALVPALAIGGTMYASTAVADTPTIYAGAVVGPKDFPVDAVVAPGSVAEYDAAADVPQIQIILPPPPPPPPAAKSGKKRANPVAAQAAVASGDHVAFCAAGGGQTAEAWSLDGLLSAANAERARFGYGSLSWSGGLASAAQGWANQLVANDESTPYAHDAIAHNPNRPRGGENVAMGYRASGQEVGKALNKAHIAWMKSNGHCKNLLNPSWSVMGAGTASTADGTTVYTVVNFQ